jgi:hypothetical protein
MVESLLDELVVVEPDIAFERLLQIVPALEVPRTEHLGDASVEAFDHAVGLGSSDRCQAVLDAQCLAELVKAVISRRLALSRGEQSVGELLAVVGEDRADPKGCGGVQALEKSRRRACRLVAHQADIDPTCRPVDRDEGVAALILILHLRQILHVDVNKPRLVVLEALGRGFLLWRFQISKAADATPSQQSIQGRSAHLRFDELPNHRQQIIQRQPQRGAQIHHQFLLPFVQRRLQPMGRMTAVLYRLSAAPFAYRVERQTILPRQLGRTGRRGLDRTAYRWSGGRVLVQADQHSRASFHSASAARRTSRLSSSGRRL